MTLGTFSKKKKIQVEDESGLGLPPASGDAGGDAGGDESKERPKECHRPVEEVACTAFPFSRLLRACVWYI
jgi:hypothetical protein